MRDVICADWMKRLLVHALLAPGGTDKKSLTDIRCTILLVSMVAGQATITGEVCVPAASLKEPAGPHFRRRRSSLGLGRSPPVRRDQRPGCQQSQYSPAGHVQAEVPDTWLYALAGQTVQPVLVAAQVPPNPAEHMLPVLWRRRWLTQHCMPCRDRSQPRY
jgi:hypothetical protein